MDVRDVRRSSVTPDLVIMMIRDVFFDLCLNYGWVNNREAGDLRSHRAHYDVTVTAIVACCLASSLSHNKAGLSLSRNISITFMKHFISMNCISECRLLFCGSGLNVLTVEWGYPSNKALYTVGLGGAMLDKTQLAYLPAYLCLRPSIHWHAVVSQCRLFQQSTLSRAPSGASWDYETV